MPRIFYSAKIIPRVYVRSFRAKVIPKPIRQRLDSRVVACVHDIIGEVDKKLGKTTFRSSIIA